MSYGKQKLTFDRLAESDMALTLYKLILRLHPSAFRCRFSDEMLSIFEEHSRHRLPFALLVDGVTSLARQWIRRVDCWKVPIPICGALFQVLWFFYPRKGHQNWPENPHIVTPYLQEIAIVTLAILGTLFFLILSLTAWTVRFQRRRPEGRSCQ